MLQYRGFEITDYTDYLGEYGTVVNIIEATNNDMTITETYCPQANDYGPALESLERKIDKYLGGEYNVL